jgi:hypothetical protein
MVASMNRPVTRRFTRILGSARRGLSRAASLFSRAGLADRPEFEHLENRQMLFALTITPEMVNPTTGVGTIFAFFGYAIPYLAPTTEAADPQQTEVDEDFNQSVPGVPGTAAAIIPSGFMWPQSNFRVVHNLPLTPPALAGMRLIREPGSDTENQVQIQNMSGGQQFTISQTLFDISMELFEITIRGGFSTSFITVELLSNGVVVDSFTGEALAQLGTPVTEPPFGTRYSFARTNLQTFDQIRFRANPGAPSMTFGFDDLYAVLPARPFDPILEPRLFGVSVAFTGPAGATAEFFDLHDRPMQLTIEVGRPPGAQILLIDRDGDGIPNFNDGIGRIIMSNVNHRSALTLWGGTLGASLNPPADADFVEAPRNVFYFRYPTAFTGLFSSFEAAGMGYAARPANTVWEVSGLPPAAGSVIVGAPFIRPLTNYNITGLPPGQGTTVVSGFNRANQGIFVNDGSNFGSLLLHGILFGSSRFTGAVERMTIGSLMGSIGIHGDLGFLTVSGDAGAWVDDEGVAPNGARGVTTSSQLVIGRTLGEVAVGGRNLLNITVRGDLNNPEAPSRDLLRYYEREYSSNIITGTVRDIIRNIVQSNGAAARNSVLGQLGLPFVQADQSLPYGNVYTMNDTIMTAEWVGSSATAVQIFGTLGRRDLLVNVGDPSDVYAFPVDGTQEIVVQSEFLGPGMYMRIVDSHGRTLAAVPASANPRDSATLRFRPDGPGVYYLVLQTVRNTPQNAIPVTYVVYMTGLAPVTWGAYRTGAASGNIPETGLTHAINLQAGSMGAILIDSGFLGGTRQPADPSGILNAPEEAIITGLRAGTFTVPGNLYGLIAGEDIEGNPGLRANFNIGGSLGMVRTGLAFPGDAEQGDLRYVNINTGGSIGYMFIQGGIGIDQDVESRPYGVDVPQSVVIRTGLDPLLKGDIAFIRVGSHVGGDTLVVRTSNNSTVGGFAVSQDRFDDEGEPDFGIFRLDGLANGVDFNLGANSDMRFFDAPRIDLLNIRDHTMPIPPNGGVLALTDDAGGVVRISILGGNGEASGSVRVLPISDSLGMAIGRIEVDLTGGGILQIQSQQEVGRRNVISIGRIVVRGAEANSAIRIIGNAQVDVWQISQEDGGPFNEIVNTTPNGDIVAIDVDGLNSIQIGTGDLGRTETPSWGPKRIGPFLGVGAQTGGVYGTIGLSAGVITEWWRGGNALYRPVNDSVFTRQARVYLDDVGGPIDPFLDGIIVRTGDLQSVIVGGGIGDVIVPAGVLVNVVANSNNTTPAGRFEGLFGNIYALRIGNVDIGDGLAARAHNSIADTGIIAIDDINVVVGTRRPNANIASNIIAGNLTPLNADTAFPIDGIARIELRGGGHYNRAWIGATNLDMFWTAYFNTDDVDYTGAINQLLGTDANFLRSHAAARTLNTMRFLNGYYDASLVEIAENAVWIEARGFRNSTVTGGSSEFYENRITVAGLLNMLTTSGRAGDINDLHVQILGRLGEVAARNVSRSLIESDVEIARLNIAQSVRGSEIVTGLLTSATIGRDIRASRLAISGPLLTMTVGDSITNSEIIVSGPDGRIGNVTVANLLSGNISVAGPIGTLRVTNGDMIASIRTIVNQRGILGDIGLLQAGRDLDIRTDIDGSIQQMIAGRNVGNRATPGVILVRGDVQNLSVPAGQLYSDLRIGQRLVSGTIGTAVHRPNASNLGLGSIVAFGRIENVTINGDFGGDIISYSGGIGVVTINDGSLLPGALIAAYDGDLNNLIINNGNLYGDVHADYILWSIRLNGSADGVFGHVGIHPGFSAGTPYSPQRNQHPPGVIANSTIQGPRITAGHNLGRVILTNGSMFEAFLYAARAIGTIEVGGDIRNDNMTGGHGTVIAAGSSIFTVRVMGSMSDTMILAGIRDFGANQRAGGTGINADWVESGRIENIDIRGNASNIIVSAGIDPGADGMYNTADDLVAMGVSFVRNVTIGGFINNVSVFADSEDVNAAPEVIRGGHNLAHRNPDIYKGGPIGMEIPGDGTPVAFSWNNATGTVTFTGPGRVFWDQATGRLILWGTTLESQILVTSNTSILRDFIITTTDDASVGTLRVEANLFGDSRIVIDGYALNIATWDLHDQSIILVGMNTQSISTGTISGGHIQGMYWVRDIVVNGNFGTPADFDEASIRTIASSSITIRGQNAAFINVDRDLGALTVSGPVDRAQFRTGATVGAVTVGSLFQTRISVRDRIGPVVVNGNMQETTIQAGGDLGSTILPGPGNATTAGHIASVVINGNMERSSIVAGLIRGPDGFFGTTDDFVAPGRSTLGPVTVSGTATGSNRQSEQYRIAATGSMGQVRINNAPGANQGNFQITDLATMPAPILVLDLQSTIASMVWTTWIHFNQSMNESTIGPALTVTEVRRDPEQGIIEIPLVAGVDYTLTPYDRENDRIGVIFARHITDRNLDDESGAPGDQPGPGVYRFRLSADVLRATVVNARLAANMEGFGNTTRDFSGDAIVGDAGDKFQSNIATTPLGGRVDFYGPVDLDIVLDDNYNPNGLPDTNTVYTLRGTIGDHQDHDFDVFRIAGDADIYKVTLRAGQILRLGAMDGSARFAGRILVNELGQPQGGLTSHSLQLPADPLNLIDLTTSQHFLIKETGTYYVIVANHDLWDDPDLVPVVNPASGIVGDYRFTIEIFDDGKSGFAADTDSGDGMAIVNAPAPIVFAGPSGIFGTEDDRSEVIIGDFIFFLDPGPDGIRGTEDDIVTGSNSQGVVSTRAGNQLTSTVEAAIGPRGHAGVPGTATPDVDVYHLNNRQPIAPGQLITVKVKLAEMGADLGSFSHLTFTDFRGDVQFGVFDTTSSQGIDDALLIFSPTEFLPIAGEPGQLAAQNQAVYGFDENGDFFITFITPGRIDGQPDEPASYAVYIQGVFNTDYRLEITQTDAAQNVPFPRAAQNVFLELKGGTVDWLEVAGLTTELAPFSASVLGFVGSMEGRPVDQFIMDNVLANLRALFDATGMRVNISTNASDFEFQDFSTVFLTRTTDPIATFTANNFGYSQRSDPFNLDRNDDAVLFMPSFATLGYTGTSADLDDFVLSLTTAIGRRVGEMLGLRMTLPAFTPQRDVMSANSVQGVPLLGPAEFRDQARPLSHNLDVLSDTNFFLGYQNSLAMLQRYLRP